MSTALLLPVLEMGMAERELTDRHKVVLRAALIDPDATNEEIAVNLGVSYGAFKQRAGKINRHIGSHSLRGAVLTLLGVGAAVMAGRVQSGGTS